MLSVLELTPAYLDSEAKMVELHRIMMAGGGDSVEAEALRDRMDRPWWAMTEEQREVIGDLSADLYQVTHEEVFVTVADDLLLEALKEMFAVSFARGDWRRVLGILRRRPRTAPDGPVASLRAHAYRQLGLEVAAKEFEDFAKQVSGGEDIITDADLDTLKDAVWAIEENASKAAVAQ
jgi:hypothetical protein